LGGCFAAGVSSGKSFSPVVLRVMALSDSEELSEFEVVFPASALPPRSRLFPADALPPTWFRWMLCHRGVLADALPLFHLRLLSLRATKVLRYILY
jgi:hypothetical protein